MTDKQKKAREGVLSALPLAEVVTIAVDAEIVIAEKNEEINDLKSGLAETQKHLDRANQLNSNVATLETTVSTQNSAIEALEAQIVTKDDAIENLEAEMLRLNEALSASEKNKGRKNFGTFKLGGKNYEITAPKFSYNSVEYKAAELVSNTTLQKELVEINAGFIKIID